MAGDAPRKPCKTDGCGRQSRARGLCKTHYQKNMRDSRAGRCELEPMTRFIPKGCSVKECGKPHKALGLCRFHHDRHLNGRPLVGPTPKRAPSEIVEDGSFALVALTGSRGEGKHAVISKEDLDKVSGHRWWLSARGYAVSSVSRTIVKMHRILMGNPRECEVDHVDGDRLNNSRQNLRLATHKQNAENKAHSAASGHRNVYGTTNGKWRVVAKSGGVTYRAGTFERLDDAVQAARSLRSRVFTHHNEARA